MSTTIAAGFTIHGVKGDLATGKYASGRLRQRWVSEGRPYRAYGRASARIHAVIQFDNELGNPQAYFSLTASLSGVPERDAGSIGCAHDDIAKAFPELAHLVRWHLAGPDGPMHYLANTVFLAGDRDSNGLRKGEARQIRNGRTGELCWQLEAVNAPGVALSNTPTGQGYQDAETVPLYILDKTRDCDPECLPVVPELRWVPWLRQGEGKARELDSARKVAIWPEATDEELCQEPEALKAALAARIPALIEVFRADIAASGLVWPVEV